MEIKKIVQKVKDSYLKKVRIGKIIRKIKL